MIDELTLTNHEVQTFIDNLLSESDPHLDQISQSLDLLMQR